jgi:hypothetical protein
MIIHVAFAFGIVESPRFDVLIHVIPRNLDDQLHTIKTKEPNIARSTNVGLEKVG